MEYNVIFTISENINGKYFNTAMTLVYSMYFEEIENFYFKT